MSRDDDDIEQPYLNGNLGSGSHEISAQDEADIEQFRDRAIECGYDKLVIHPPTDSVDGPVSAYVAAHRTGEPWSRWAFGRVGPIVIAWNTMSGDEVGAFPIMADALETVLCGHKKN